jgi:small subunit ribosomal protein S18|tara:strand:+ start:678 stop:995 length:318 start_codon:yes stop_codon:yes gene_type:complete
MSPGRRPSQDGPERGGGKRDGARRGGGGGAGAGGGGMRRRKVCRFCVDKIDYIDYKDVRVLMMAIPERGKIQPRRLSGTCAKHQRKLTTAVKRARQLALIPYVTD